MHKAERSLPLILAGIVIAVLIGGLLDDSHGPLVMGFPALIGAITVSLCGAVVAGAAAKRSAPAPASKDRPAVGDDGRRIAGLLALVPLVAVLGFPLGMAAFLVLYVRIRGHGWVVALSLGAGGFALAFGVFERLLGVPLPPGLIESLLPI